MERIRNIEDAKEYIYNFNLYKTKTTEQDVLFNKLALCEQIALEHNEKKLLIHSRIFLTDYYIQINDIHKALKLALENKSLAESENFEEEQLNCYSGLLNIHHLLGDYSSLEELISIYREKLINSNNISKLCSLYIISGIQYYTLKEHKKCFEANEKAIEYALQINNTQLLIHVYNNYGFHALNYDLDLSHSLLLKCITLIKTGDNDSNLYMLSVVNINLADLYFLKKDYKKCNKCLDISISILKKINNKNLLLEAENKLCELFIKIKKYETARKILIRNEAICLESNNRHILVTIYNSFHILFNILNESNLAYQYLLKYIELKDAIFNEESVEKIRNLQITNEVKEIKLQRDHAERLAHLKHDFLANMSHEIRTPINSVLGICYLLQQDNLNEKQQSYIHRLERNSENLLNLINEILDLSKIEAGKLELISAPFSFNSVLKDVTQSLQQKADEKNIDLIFKSSAELERIISGDAQRISQILINIIANAIKFTDKGFVKISTTILSTKNNSDKMMISCIIEDTGIGIPKDKIETIFERYEQAYAGIKTKFGGTGLGLAISKRLLELMDGQIAVKSQLNKGTTFNLTFPFATQNIKIETAVFSEITDTSFLDNFDFIIADDIEESRLVTKEILMHFNPSLFIREAENGKEVLHLLKSKIPTILLIDLDMPVMNGFETVTEIRKKYQASSIIIIAYTAGLLSMTKEEILNLGFDELLLKPFKPNELLQKLFWVMNRNFIYKKAESKLSAFFIVFYLFINIGKLEAT